MKIEYLPDGGDLTPLVLLYGRDWEACQTLAEGFQHLADGKVRQVLVHAVPGFEALGGVTLTARVGDKDIGVNPAGEHAFECVLSKAGWKRVAEALQPFCRPQSEDSDAHQALDRSGKVSLVVATARGW